MLGWAPAVFWAASPHEFHAALDGYMERWGLKAVRPMSRKRLEELLAEDRRKSGGQAAQAKSEGGAAGRG